MINKRTTFICFITILIFFSRTVVECAELRLGETEIIKTLGFAFKTFEGFESRPISFPDIFADKKTKEKYYKVTDIWRYKQYVGSWGNSNALLNISEMAFLPPDNSSAYITEEKVSEKYETKSESIYWDKGEKLKWLELFTGKKIVNKIRSIRDKSGTVLEYYPLKDKNSYLGLFVISNKRKLKNNLVFLYTVNFVLPEKQAMEQIFSSVQSIRFGHTVKQTHTKKNKENPNPDYEVSKEKVIRNIKNLKDWWGIDSKDYFLITNYPKNSKSFIKKLEAELILSQKIYSHFYKRTVPLKEVNVVRILKERDDYAAYVGNGKKWTMGLWMPSKKELVISPLLYGNREDSELAQAKILRHEAFHQYIHFALDQVQTSPWFNEGSAVFFEGVKIVGKKLKTEPSNYLKLLKKMIEKKKPDIPALLKMNYKQFYSGNGSREKVSENYALAWGIVYFLHKGAYTVKRRTDRDYTKILKTYYKELIKTKSPEEATKLAWRKINMKKFTEDFEKCYKTLY